MRPLQRVGWIVMQGTADTDPSARPRRSVAAGLAAWTSVRIGLGMLLTIAVIAAVAYWDGERESGSALRDHRRPARHQARILQGCSRGRSAGSR